MSSAPATNLSLADVAKVSELKDLGWTVDTDVKPFFAFEKDGDLRKIGPASSIKALHTQVMIAVGNNKTVKVGSSKLEGGEYKDIVEEESTKIVPDHTEIQLTEDSQGNTYLPGTGPRVNSQLASTALTHYRIKTERMRLTKDEKEAKDKLIAVTKVHKDLFTKNGEGKMVYMAGDVEIEYIHEEKDNVKTKLIGNDDGEDED